MADSTRWGDYWRLTIISLQNLLAVYLPADHISVKSYGNVLAAVDNLHGIVVEDLTSKEHDHHDPEYQATVTARIQRPV